MTQKQAKQITKYMLKWLDYLDGRGIVFEDTNLVKKELIIAEAGGYPDLESILK